MSGDKNCISFRDCLFICRHIRPFIGYCFLLIVLLCHGCSSNVAGTGGIKQLPLEGDTGQVIVETAVQDDTGKLSGVQRIEFDTTSYDLGKIHQREI